MVKEKKEGNTHSGRSYSNEWPKGRRRALAANGKMLAPRSLRRKGRVFLSDCKKSDLRRIGLPESEVEMGAKDDTAEAG